MQAPIAPPNGVGLGDALAWLFATGLLAIVVTLIKMVKAQKTPGQGPTLADRVATLESGYERLEERVKNIDREVERLRDAR